MSNKKNLYAVSDSYVKRMNDPNWRVGKPEELKDFEKGAQQSGMGQLKEGLGNLKADVLKAWRGLRK